MKMSWSWLLSMVSLDPGIHSSKLCVPERKAWRLIWEDCIQEEARVANREAMLKEDDKALATHTKRGRSQSNFKKESNKDSWPPKKFQRKRGNNQRKYHSDFQCFNCHKIGHIARNCPLKKEEYKKNKRHHAHLAKDEEEEEEGTQRKIAKEEYAKDYVLFYALHASVIPGEDTWLIDSGASKHMTGLLTQKIPHSALYGLHHPRTPMHDPHFTPLDPHTLKKAYPKKL